MKKSLIGVVIVIVTLTSFVGIVYGANIDFLPYRAVVICRSCETGFDNSQKDSYGRSRQYGTKFCKICKNNLSKEAVFYKRGYTDYNCMAYAMGKNSKCSWMWPNEWGDKPSINTVKNYFSTKGYKVVNYDSKSWSTYKSKKAIFVYAKDSVVTHFARVCTLDGKFLSDTKTISKWGKGALYTTPSMDPYNGGKTPYGKCSFVCYK